MAMVGDEGLWLVRLLIQRGLALLYLLAFLVAARQFRPLAGVDGLLPLDDFVDRRSFRERPSLFHRFPDDRAVTAAAWLGLGLSALALLGAPSWLPRPLVLPAAMALWAAMWGLYLSFVNAGQLFYGYGWESMLLETGFLAIFLGAGPFATPVVVVWLLRWVLFSNLVGGGLIKLRGDDCWRQLTCLDHHYETQPIPNPLSWFAHHLPDRFHRLEVLGNHVVELAFPFLYFAPQPFAAAAGLATIGFQGWLMLTGNFSWLNALTIVLAASTFADGQLAAVLPLAPPAATAPLPPWLWVAVLGVTALVLVLSVRPTRNMLSRTQVMNTAFDPLHLVNTYGAFGSITRTRYELVVEGTDATAVTPATDWEAYAFYGKPTDPGRRPPQLAPYHLRLDWQFWFAAMSPTPRRHPWVYRFVEALLRGDDDIEALLRSTPFEDAPTHVRIRRYRYRFTTPDERAATGDWWHREPVGTYLEPTDHRRLQGSGVGRRSARVFADGGDTDHRPGGRLMPIGQDRDPMERWVRRIVAGGLALLGGLWLAELVGPATGSWPLGSALAVVGAVVMLWGIADRVELGG